MAARESQMSRAYVIKRIDGGYVSKAYGGSVVSTITGTELHSTLQLASTALRNTEAESYIVRVELRQKPSAMYPLASEEAARYAYGYSLNESACKYAFDQHDPTVAHPALFKKIESTREWVELGEDE